MTAVRRSGQSSRGDSPLPRPPAQPPPTAPCTAPPSRTPCSRPAWTVPLLLPLPCPTAPLACVYHPPGWWYHLPWWLYYLKTAFSLYGGGSGLVPKSCPTLFNPIDCNLPGSSVHGISQARILEWAAIALPKVVK